MSRLLVAALVSLLAVGQTRAQSTSETKDSAKAAQKPSAAVDPQIRQEVQKEVAKVKAELESQLRAEAQTTRAATQFVGPAPDTNAKLQFLQLNGYFRMRGDLFDQMDLNRDADPAGYYLFPRPLINSDHRGTITTGNLRLRLEPTINVSEDIRIRTQIDVLDNLVLGSTPDGLFQNVNEDTPIPFLSASQAPPESGVNSNRASIRVKRVWADVHTPVGVLSFGRMSSEWGLGILSNAGNGMDDDFGDTVDRLQFSMTLRDTPVGQLTITPQVTWLFAGAISQDSSYAGTVGQPFDRDQGDDGRAFGLQLLRSDTPERRRERFDAGLPVFGYGAWYSYRAQSFDLVGYNTASGVPSEGSSNESQNTNTGPTIKRKARAHVLDLWGKVETKRMMLAAELTGIYGQIDNFSNEADNPLGPVLLRQFGGVLQGNYQVIPSKLTLGGEIGLASGDRNPGMGNAPGRICAESGCKTYGVIDGPQVAANDNVLDMRNFNFNRAYRVDLILWREILGGVTDAFYLKPTARWDIVGGVAANLAVIYSQALYAESTPSSTGPGTGNKPLGIEMDVGLSYESDDRFSASLSYGLMQPLSGFNDDRPGASKVTRAHALRGGLGIKF